VPGGLHGCHTSNRLLFRLSFCLVLYRFAAFHGTVTEPLDQLPKHARLVVLPKDLKLVCETVHPQSSQHVPIDLIYAPFAATVHVPLVCLHKPVVLEVGLHEIDAELEVARVCLQ